MATKRHVIPQTIFDTDLTGLYQPEQGITILDKTLRYRPPNLYLHGLIYTFLIEVVGEVVSTPLERETLTPSQLYEKVFNYFESMKQPTEDEEVIAQKEKAMGQMFLEPKGNRILLEAIRYSFPDVQDPQTLTDNAFIQLSNFIFGTFNQPQE